MWKHPSHPSPPAESYKKPACLQIMLMMTNEEDAPVVSCLVGDVWLQRHHLFPESTDLNIHTLFSSELLFAAREKVPFLFLNDLLWINRETDVSCISVGFNVSLLWHLFVSLIAYGELLLNLFSFLYGNKPKHLYISFGNSISLQAIKGNTFIKSIYFDKR